MSVGDKILRAHDALEGEDRQITVLWADGVALHPLAVQRDPAAIATIRDGRAL